MNYYLEIVILYHALLFHLTAIRNRNMIVISGRKRLTNFI